MLTVKKMWKAYADVAELSDNENHRLSAIYLKALVALDNNNLDQVNQEIQRLVEQDDEIADAGEAKADLKLLYQELLQLRK